MIIERSVSRYSAYYLNWCQAFGEHQSEAVTGEDDIQWLIGEQCIGFIVPTRTKRLLLKELIERRPCETAISFSRRTPEVEINGAVSRAISASNTAALSSLTDLLEDCDRLHMYLTYHLFYPPGTRIITFSARKPLIILYKEIEPMVLKISD